jgi:tight adherence protein C
VSSVGAALVVGAVAAAAALAAGVAIAGWPPGPGPQPLAASPPHRRHSADRVTVALLGAAGFRVPDIAARRQLRRWGALVVLALIAAPAAAGPVALGGWVWARRRHHRRRRDRDRAIGQALPDAVDLLALCTRAGLALPIAHARVAARLTGPVGAALTTAATEAGAGRGRADALVDALVPLGDRAATLAHVLAEHLRYGVPLGPALDRLGTELRAARRREAEEDARRVPVRLLGPLVACVLPAFGLLTVVPLLAASLRALPA